MKINEVRLLDDIESLGQIGFRPGQGITRLALTAEDLQARQWLMKRMEALDLEVRIDAAANVIGRLAGTGALPGTVIIGSHLDTVPQGGPLDGALGILAGLECVRVLQEHQVPLPFDLEIINFTDEEGYRYAGTFGSRAMMGWLQPEEIHQSRMDGVCSLGERLQDLGLDPARIDQARRDPADILAYLELHIEQGSRLERDALDIGVVTGIVGIYRYVVEVLGDSNHAGTTPMDVRSDALVAAAPIFSLLPEWARARSPNMVATIGQLALEPGAVNIIPGRCRFVVELRSLLAEDMIRIRDHLEDYLEAHVQHHMHTVYEKDGVFLDEDLIDRILGAAKTADCDALRMPSGAGHDAQSFATKVPTGMIFIPSQGGRSHCPEECSEPGWVVQGAQVLLNTLLSWL